MMLLKQFLTKTVTLITIFTLLLLPELVAQTKIDSSRIVRVLSFNIYHGETMKGDFDLDLIANVIKSVDPDLVALQEVDFNTNRAKNMDLPVELALRTGLTPLFGKAMSFDGGEYGEGVLSKYSFFSTKNHGLTTQQGKEPRSALEVNVVIQSGDSIRFIGTHLDHTENETDRINQAKKINELYSKDDVPAILAGDLNAQPESKTMQLFYKEWEKPFSENVPTFPSNIPNRKIDYILFRPAKRWRVIETKVICDEIASDHCAVLSVLELLD
jgi:endonuclease/exonuclease/phosphatase family metal-dependent hydrolase